MSLRKFISTFTSFHYPRMHSCPQATHHSSLSSSSSAAAGTVAGSAWSSSASGFDTGHKARPYARYHVAECTNHESLLLLVRQELNQPPAAVSGQTCPNTLRQSNRSATSTLQSAFISAVAELSGADAAHELDPYAPSTRSRSATFTRPSLFTSPMHGSLRFRVVESPSCMPLPTSPDP